MKQYKYFVLASAFLFLIPGVAFAISNMQGFLQTILSALGAIIPILIGVAVAVFFYGVAKFILAASNANAQARAGGIKFMIYGVVALFVMVSIWGLVALLQNSLLGSDQVRVFQAPMVF